LIASIGAALAYNFFFLPPLYTLTITDPQNVVTLIVFVIVAVVASQLAGQVRREANLGARTATENAALAVRDTDDNGREVPSQLLGEVCSVRPNSVADGAARRDRGGSHGVDRRG
jgi:hypothetical protein